MREARQRREACYRGGRGLRHRGQIGRAVVGRKVGQRRWRTGRAWGRVGLSSPKPVGRQPGWTAADRGDWPPRPPHRSSLGRWERTRQSSLSRPGRGRGRRERGCTPSPPTASPSVCCSPEPCRLTCLGSSDAREKPLVNQAPKPCDPVNFLGS